MDVWIDERGNVFCVKITRSIPWNDQAAINAVRQWKFDAHRDLSEGRPAEAVQKYKALN